MKPIKKSTIFERLHVDIVGSLKQCRNGSRFNITAIDAFSRYAYARPAKEVRGRDVVSSLNEEVSPKHGIPAQILRKRTLSNQAD